MAKPTARGPGRPPAGRTKIMVSLDPKQVTALRREAFARVGGQRGRPDVSAVVREILAEWMRRRAK